MAKIHRDYVRSGVFGFEDALVSTTGVIVGISTGTSNKEFIILAGFVTIMVEAISMAAGQFLSERTLHQMDKVRHRDNLTTGSMVMFVSYFLGGIAPILPVFFLPVTLAVVSTLIIAFLGLFTLGYVKGKIVKIPPTRSAIEMLLIGGAATIIGAVAGYFLRT